MSALNEFWNQLGRRARTGLIVGGAIIVLGTAALGVWLLRTDYQVLFADLTPQDAASMVTELDRLKVPYRLSGGGGTILVPTDVVHRTRLKLVGTEMPLHGAVGFELFNNSEVGMTEFAQKVNYQRALQGELTRTILSLDEVQSARVHLVLSEQGLFRKKGTQAKASITLAPKPGKVLDASQIQGIQRLVSAAVPDIKAGDVTIVDQRGVAMTRHGRSEDDDGGALAADGLDEKRAFETYLNRKVADVLDRAFGPGQGIASVDVTLGHEHTKTTTENVLGTTPDADGRVTGIVITERETDASGGEAPAAGRPVPAGGGVASHEVNYQVGRRVEQVISRSGAVSHINVAVVVRTPLLPTQLENLKDLVASAVGINRGRGDSVAVYSLQQITSTSAPNAPVAAAVAAGEDIQPAPAAPGADGPALEVPGSSRDWLAVIAGVLAISILVGFWRRTVRPAGGRVLSIEDRERALAQVRLWLEGPRPQPAEEQS